MDQQAEEVIQSLLRAVESNDIERTRTILQANEGLVNQQLDKRGTALHVACDVGNFDTCLLLLDFGANIESDNNKLKETPIFEAVKNGHVPILQLLKERGCDLNIKNKEDTGPLFYAAKFGHAAAVQILLDSGVSVNEKHQFAWTALQEACWNNHRAVAESLISSGADVNAKDRLWGWSALHFACFKNHSEVAEVLISSGADVNAENVIGRRPFDFASEPLRTTVQFSDLYRGSTICVDCVKICFIGPPEAGKSTLYKAIRRSWLYSWVSADETAVETSHLEERTVGMEVFEADISSVGHVILYDFAGQFHFHRTHSIFFHPFNTIYILVLNGELSEEEILSEGRYWLSFLSASSPAGSRPVVVIVISRADTFSSYHMPTHIDQVLTSLKILFEEQLHIQHRYFALDCRKSQSKQMKEFRAFLAEIKRNLLQTQSKYPGLCEPVLKILPKLRKTMDSHLMELADFISILKTEAPVESRQHFSYLSDLIVEFLHTSGEVFVVDDVVFLTIAWLSSYILGPVIEPRCWFKGLPQPNVTRDQLARLLKEFRPRHLPEVEIKVDHAAKALKHLGVAFEVHDHPGVYCIPAHLPERARRELWQTQADNKKVYVGKRVECRRETDIFTPGLFPFFQSKAAACLDVHAKMYKGWMKMVKIHDDDVATECLVEMTNRDRAIDIVVRGPTDSKQQCVSFLDTVTTSLDELLKEKSPGTQVERYYLSPTHMSEMRDYPAGFREADVQSAVAKGPKAKVVSHWKDDVVTEDVCNLFAFSSICEPLHSNPVIRAVLRHGRDQWLSVGVEMGYSMAEVESVSHDKPSHGDKLLSIILRKIENLGEKGTVALLLKACRSIPSPIYGAVMDQLTLEGYNAGD